MRSIPKVLLGRRRALRGELVICSGAASPSVPGCLRPSKNLGVENEEVDVAGRREHVVEFFEAAPRPTPSRCTRAEMIQMGLLPDERASERARSKRAGWLFSLLHLAVPLGHTLAAEP